MSLGRYEEYKKVLAENISKIKAKPNRLVSVSFVDDISFEEQIYDLMNYNNGLSHSLDENRQYTQMTVLSSLFVSDDERQVDGAIYIANNARFESDIPIMFDKMMACCIFEGKDGEFFVKQTYYRDKNGIADNARFILDNCTNLSNSQKVLLLLATEIPNWLEIDENTQYAMNSLKQNYIPTLRYGERLLLFDATNGGYYDAFKSGKEGKVINTLYLKAPEATVYCIVNQLEADKASNILEKLDSNEEILAKIETLEKKGLLKEEKEKVESIRTFLKEEQAKEYEM